MIAKNIKGKSFKGCVSYVMNDTATILEAEGIWADNTKNILRSFAMQRSGRKEIKQPVGHIPISFSPEDKDRMADEFMVQLAKEYMQEMGIKNTQYIIVRHHNADNEHLHIVYNRIDNDLKLISVNQDYKRNIKTCKMLKDKHNLTYGEGKDRVKREKLNNPDAVKYLLHDIIKAILPYCTSEKEFQYYLQSKGINVKFKHKRTTGEIEGISFNYDNVSFKGSQIDRKFSFGNLKKEFEKNLKIQQEQAEKEQQQAEKKLKTLTIGGIELTSEQWEILKNGGYIYLEKMNRNDGKGQFSSYVFLNDDKNKAFFSNENPDAFVKYGKYEMRIQDKILVESGYMTKAKVKWYGGGFAYPYLWKERNSDSEYKESWGNPRLAKEQKVEVKRQNAIPKIKKGGGPKW
ncbi:relaxase/mobilization nuclease domain-containing protein [Dysgonomonas sp. Marseille-P4677]|uniref:relaxase/mobilization nuclease domain-containing protein n=1 Tax=Dysgonomonas sp. Marseille-P4677 TaxID=2364790 RepID=UPI0019149EC4|nr:relaxase/mobilization nuclease domain-containing protein [Dysgonomonas sp. Marseille-P4677]MBK5719816.1 relaxase/mobilization nuclease domain-containing protein [Dysgonomonas sp. Marseille-P4677]